MKVLVQWAKSGPVDWEEIDSSQWAAASSKPIPLGNDPIDDSSGWVNAINVQGVILNCVDHYAIEDIPDGFRVTVWNDDSEDFADGELYARVLIFKTLAPDLQFGGALNTRQSQVVYAQPAAQAVLFPYGVPEGTEVRPCDEFVAPSESVTKHGVWLSDELFEAHDKKKSVRGWREWTEGVPVDQIKDGKVIDQRKQGRYDKPLGTRTYYYSDTVDLTPIHAADHENVLSTTTGTVQTLTATIAKNKEELAFTARTPINEPQWTHWPTGNYRFQIDCTTAGVDLTYGLLTLGAGIGHFGRIDAAGTVEPEIKAQQESAFSLTGLKLATTGTVSWTSGDVGDRFEVTVAAANPNTKANQDLAIDVNEADDYADGPWPPIYVSDTVAVADQVTREVEFDRTVETDSVAVDDTTTAASLDLFLSDTVAAADATTVERVSDRSASDTISTADATMVEMLFDRSASDMSVVADQTTREVEFDRTAENDNVTVDNVTTAASLSVFLSDTAVVTDQATAESDYLREASDTAAVADQTTTELAYDLPVSDTAVVTDQATAESDYLREASDTAAVADQTAVDRTRSAAVSDTAAVSDQLTTEARYVREVSDAVAVADDVEAETAKLIAADDTIAVADDTTIEMTYVFDLSDAVVYSETGVMDRQSVETAEIGAQEEVEVEAASSGTVPIPVAGDDRILLAIISKDSDVATTAVTYDSTPLVFAAEASDGTKSVELWRLLNPATGAAKEVEVTFAGPVDATVEVVNYSGYNQWIDIDDFKFEIVRRWRTLPDDPWTEISFSFNSRQSVGFTSEMSLGISGLSERIARWVNQSDIIPIDSITALDEVSAEKL